MNEERARRIGMNEALFREVNEQVEQVNARFGRVEHLTVICECGDGECTDRIEMPTAEYEHVRADPLRFIIVPGHDMPDVEAVVESGDGYEVVKKRDGVPEKVARTDRPAFLRDSSAMGLAHWDEVESHRAAKGEMDAVWQRLGDAAGTKGVGRQPRPRRAGKALDPSPLAQRVRGDRSSSSAASGLAWQDGDVHEVRAGDCVIYEADHFEHTFVAGPEGLEYVVFGTRHPTEFAWLPRSRAIRMGYPWVEGRDDNPWEVEATAPLLEYGNPAPRPANIINVDEVEQEVWEGHATEVAARDARPLEARGPPLAAAPRRAGAAASRTATLSRRRSSSSSTAPRRSSSGRARCRRARARRSRRRRCAPVTSSRARPERASRTRSAPARTA